MLEEHALDAVLHDRTGFNCGTPELDDYLHRFALQHTRKGVTTVHVLVDSDQPSEILGYYSLSAAQIDVQQLSDADRKKLPRYPVPCFRMGRLACRADRLRCRSLLESTPAGGGVCAVGRCKKRAGQELLRTLRLHGVRRLADDALPATGLTWFLQHWRACVSFLAIPWALTL